MERKKQDRIVVLTIIVVFATIAAAQISLDVGWFEKVAVTTSLFDADRTEFTDGGTSSSDATASVLTGGVEVSKLEYSRTNDDWLADADTFIFGDGAAADQTLTFRSNADETIKFDDANDRFQITDQIAIIDTEPGFSFQDTDESSSLNAALVRPVCVSGECPIEFSVMDNGSAALANFEMDDETAAGTGVGSVLKWLRPAESLVGYTSTGFKTNRDWYPETDSTHSWGLDAFRWLAGFFDDVTVTDDVTIEGGVLAGDRQTFTWCKASPASSGTYLNSDGVAMSGTLGVPLARAGSVLEVCYSVVNGANTGSPTNCDFNARVNSTDTLTATANCSSAILDQDGCATASRGTHTFSQADELKAYLDGGDGSNYQTFNQACVTIGVVYDN